MIIFFYFIFHQQLLCQSNKVDSLLRMLNQANNSTQRIEVLNELSWELRVNSSTDALAYADTALYLSRSLQLKGQESTSLSRIGEINRRQGKYLKAKNSFLRSLKLEKEIQNDHGIARAYSQLCLVENSLGNHSSAVEYAEKSLYIFKNLGDEATIARAYGRMALVLQGSGQYEESLHHHLAGIQIKEGFGESVGLGVAYMNLGILYAEMQHYRLAKTEYMRAKKLFEELGTVFRLGQVHSNLGNLYHLSGHTDSAIYHHRRSIRIKSKGGYANRLDVNYVSLASIFNKDQIYDSALFYLRKAIELMEVSGKKEGLDRSYHVLGNILYYQNKKEEALLAYKMSEAVAQDKGDDIMRLTIYQSLANTYASMGDYENAYYFNEKLFSIEDSLSTEQSNILELKVQYEEQRKRAEILEKDQAMKESQLQKKNILINALGVVLTLTLVIFLVLIQRNRHRTMAINAERQKVFRISELMSEYKSRYTDAILLGREEERAYISSEIHDRLQNNLTLAKLSFNNSLDQILPQIRNLDGYKKANRIFDNVLNDVRRFTKQMTTLSKNEFSVVAAVKELEGLVRETGMVHFEVHNIGFDQSLGLNVEFELYAIIQELVSNVIKHADADSLFITFQLEEEKLEVLFQDNGIGYDTKDPAVLEGMGSKSIRNRVQRLTGILEVDSKIGVGTEIRIQIPRKKTH